MCRQAGSSSRRQPHSHQRREVTNRNGLQGRRGQASGHNTTKPFPDNRGGKARACATTDHALIRGGLSDSGRHGVCRAVAERRGANRGGWGRSQQRP
jgi:hypothetical protein